MRYEHLFIFVVVCIAIWFISIYFWPLIILYIYKRALLVKGGVDGPVPINTLYTVPPEVFAYPFHDPSARGSKFLTNTGTNHDTLYTAGWLNLRKGSQILHVPDMNGRYYSMQFTDPSKNTNFAYVGKRTTGTQAGVYLIRGLGWNAQVPQGMTQVSSPNNSVLVIGRTLVENDSDLPIAYDLAKQIQLTLLGD